MNKQTFTDNWLDNYKKQIQKSGQLYHKKTIKIVEAISAIKERGVYTTIHTPYLTNTYFPNQHKQPKPGHYNPLRSFGQPRATGPSRRSAGRGFLKGAGFRYRLAQKKVDRFRGVNPAFAG